MATNDDKRVLSFFEAQTLLKTTQTDITKSNKSWLTVADSKDLLTAIDYDADEVYLVNVGTTFTIKYYPNGKVWLSPVGPRFTPCGWFTPSVLRKELAENHVLNSI
jgi:hypothetical protein